MPNYLKWIKYLSWFYYGNEVLIVNQWRNVRNITCAYPKYLREYGTFPQHLISKYMNDSTMNDIFSFTSPLECTLDGQGVIRKLNFEESRVSIDLIMLGALIVIMRIIAFIALSVRARLLR